MSHALRLMICDRTCGASGLRPLGLSHAWRAGGWLYAGLRRLDAWHAAASWADALAWLADVHPAEPIAEIQLWSHGHWGCALIDGEPLDRAALAPGHVHHPALRAIGERLVPGGAALWWFRTCETFGAVAGQDFARAWTDAFGCRAAGHTFIIGVHQSGLHSLAPGAVPGWPTDEGLLRGSPAAPLAARWSGRREPHTITCAHGRVPDGW